MVRHTSLSLAFAVLLPATGLAAPHSIRTVLASGPLFDE
jgi:hypothetical protein